VMMPISFTPLCAHGVHADPNSGGGRAMACRPVGLCPPERLERGWSANRGARLTRVSAMRLRAAGGVRASETSDARVRHDEPTSGNGWTGALLDGVARPRLRVTPERPIRA
jgi:hypothetical protein